MLGCTQVTAFLCAPFTYTCDVTVTGGAVATTANGDLMTNPSGDRRTFIVQATGQFNGTVLVSLPAGAAMDAYDDVPSEAALLNVTMDQVSQ
jgi:hypothetical protein